MNLQKRKRNKRHTLKTIEQKRKLYTILFYRFDKPNKREDKRKREKQMRKEFLRHLKNHIFSSLKNLNSAFCVKKDFVFVFCVRVYEKYISRRNWLVCFIWLILAWSHYKMLNKFVVVDVCLFDLNDLHCTCTLHMHHEHIYIRTLSINHQFKVHWTRSLFSIVFNVICPCFAFHIDNNSTWKNNR